jgi:predicted O-methyltransferase YrrM
MSKRRRIHLRNRAWCDALHQLCSEWLSTHSVVAEVGSFAGESTAVFATHCRRAYAIDPWDESYREELVAGCADKDLCTFLRAFHISSMQDVERQFEKRTARFENICKLRMTSRRAARQLRHEPLDFVYIDAIHTFDAVSEDIGRWSCKIKPGGLIGGHDYCEARWPGVVAAVNATLGQPDAVYRDTSWIKVLPERTGARRR